MLVRSGSVPQVVQKSLPLLPAEWCEHGEGCQHCPGTGGKGPHSVGHGSYSKGDSGGLSGTHCKSCSRIGCLAGLRREGQGGCLHHLWVLSFVFAGLVSYWWRYGGMGG